MIEYGYACKTLGYNKIISVMNTAFGKLKPEIMPFNYRHVDYPIQYELSPNSNPQLKSKATKLLVGRLTEKIKLIYDPKSKVDSTLLAVLLEDDSKYYYLKTGVVLIILHLKLTNKKETPTSINKIDLQLNINGSWANTNRSKFNGERIGLFRGEHVIFSYLKPKFINHEQIARLDTYLSDDFYFAFELLSIHQIHDILNIDSLNVRGNIESIDDRYCHFEGSIKAYKG